MGMGDSEHITQIYKMKWNVYLIKCLVVCMGVAVVPVTPASILAVTSPNRARQLSKIIDYRKSVEVDSLTNNVRQFITLQNYLNNNLHEKVQLQVCLVSLLLSCLVLITLLKLH